MPWRSRIVPRLTAETIPIGIRNFIGNYNSAYDQLMAAGVVSTVSNGTGTAPTGGGGMGGLLNGSTSSAEVTALLQTDADTYTWTAAAIGANNASIQIDCCS